MPKYRRTGTVPGKKNYPAYGGIGARNVAMANKIAAQATPRNTTITDTSNSTDNLYNTNILFNTSTFDKKFQLNIEGWPEGSTEAGSPIVPGYFFPLPDKLKNALINAANRWNGFIKFQIDTIKQIREINSSSWKGIELLNCKFLDSGAASCGPFIYTKTTLVYGFYLQINNFYVNSLNMTQLSNVLTHELGHALGMPCFKSHLNGLLNDEEILPLIDVEIDTVTRKETSYYNSITFPLTISSYAKYTGQTPIFTRLLGTNPIKRIPLEREGGPGTKNAHWEDQTNYDNQGILYRGFKNEVMLGEFNLQIDHEHKYLISTVTISTLLTLYTKFDWGEYYTYQEINYGASEVNDKEIIDETASDIFSLKTGVILLKGDIKPYTLDRSIDFTREINQEPISIKLNCNCSPIYTNYL